MEDDNNNTSSNDISNDQIGDGIDRKRKAIDMRSVVIEGKRERKVSKHGSMEYDDRETLKAMRRKLPSKPAPKPKKEEIAAPEIFLTEPNKRKNKQAKEKELSGKIKELDDKEEAFIALAHSRSASVKRKITQRNAMKLIPEGPTFYSDIETAIIKSIEQCSSLLLDWLSRPVKLIGALCKVFWDGDNEWFYARVLNYDDTTKMHYIYYLADQTAEWISLEEEYVLVVESMVMARTGRQGWPSQQFWASPKAQLIVQTFKGYKKDNVYVEYYTPEILKEYAFIPEKNLDPLCEPYVPSKMSKKMELAMDCARQEQETIDEIVDMVISKMSKRIFKVMIGNELLGLRVRALTHRLVRSNDNDRATFSAKCVGTIANYSQATEEHLVIFDEEMLQPQWLVSRNEEMDVTLGRESDQQGAWERYQGSILDPNNCFLCGAGELQLSEEIRQVEEPTQLEDSARPVRKIIPKSTFGEIKTQITQFLKCSRCSHYFHDYCMPSSQKNIDLQINGEILCCKCVKCFGCTEMLINKGMMMWNLNKVHRLAPDVKVPYCGDCIHGYKHQKDFCPICLKLYEANDYGENKDLQISQELATVAVEAAIVEDDKMVQCNECSRWVHALCEGIDQSQYEAMTLGTHPVWGDEYLCPICRVDISMAVINALQAEDKLCIFGEPVTEVMAKNYFDIIRNPMDLSTMKDKANRGLYKSLQSLRQDFELMCLNAVVFNKSGDEYWTAAIDFQKRGKNTFDNLKRATHITAFGAEMAELLANFNKKDDRDSSNNQNNDNKNKKSKLSHDDGVVEVTVHEEMDTSSTPSKESDSQNVSPLSGRPKLDDDPLQVFLPVDVVPNPEPASYFSCSAVVLPSEEAFYSCFRDQCLYCGSAGTNDMFIYCIDCGEAFHSFCVDIPLVTMSIRDRLNWRCVNCKICEVCLMANNEDMSMDESQLIYCETCDKAFHLGCLTPVLSEVPGTSWICGDCCKCETCQVKQRTNLSKKNCWATDSKKCCLCVHDDLQEEKKMKEAMLVIARTENGLMVVEDIEMQTYLRTCNVCNTVCSREFFKCSVNGCGRMCHYRCYGIENTFCIREEFSHLICKICEESKVDDKYSTHIGAGKKAFDILSTVSKIQRKRHLMEGESNANDRKIFEFSVMAAWVEYVDLYKGIIKWAILRMLALEKNNNIDKLAFSDTLPVSTWIRQKAFRFIAMYRSRVFSDRRLNIINGVTSKGKKMSLPVLSIHAAMAAAFIHCSDEELGISEEEPEKDKELVQVVKEMINNVFEQHGTGPEQSTFEIDAISKWTQELHEFSILLTVPPVSTKSVDNDGGLNLLWDPRHDSKRKLLGIETIKKRDVIIESNDIAVNARNFDNRMIIDANNNSSSAISIIDTMSGDSAYAKKYQSQKIKDDATELETYQKIIHDSNSISLSVEAAIERKRHRLTAKFEEEFEKFKETVDSQTDNMISNLSKEIACRIEELQSNSSTNSDNHNTTFDFNAYSANHSAAINATAEMNNLSDKNNGDAVVSVSEHVYVADEMNNSNDANTSNFQEVDLTADTADDANATDVQEMDTTVDTTDEANTTDVQEMDTAADIADDEINTSDLHEMDATADVADDDVNNSDLHEMDTTADAIEAYADASETHEMDTTADDVDDDFNTATAVDSNLTARKIYQPGDAVTVLSRSWPGINKPGGAAHVTARNEDGTYNVRYILTSSKDKNVPADYVSDLYQMLKNIDDVGDNTNENNVGDFDEIRLELNNDQILISESILRRQSRHRSCISVEPLQGWPQGSMGPDITWRDNRFCCLCRENGEDNICGRLLQLSSGGECVHVNCIRFSYGVHESNGKLKNVVSTITTTAAQGYKRICPVCRGRGASIKCSRKGCNTFYHLKCALSLKCLFYECVPASQASDTGATGLGDLYTIMQCIAHRDLNQPVLNKNKIIETRDSLETASLSSLEWIPWIPHNPMRLMLIEDNGDANDKSLPHELSQTSGDRAIRSGAGTVLSIGKIQVDNMNFHTEKHIFPCNFRSSRIFWSMTRPMKRTVYLFEILHQTDLTMEEEEELFNTSVQEEDKEDDDGDVDKNKTLPVFRAVAVDNPTHVMISRSINDLYNGILKAIKQINKDDLYAAFEERAQLDAYGLNAYQFFCLSLPFTRHAIELIPEAVSAMFALPPYPQYKPSYYLPSEDAVVRLQQKRLLSLLPNRISANGCARADSYEVVVRSRGTRVTRILSKAVDDSARSTGEDEKSNDILIDEGAESRREKEMNTFRYMELSASYLVNPFARLEVRKSAIHGFGLFTKTRFDKNDMIVEYIGQKIRQVVADRREIHYEEEGVGSCYLFRLDKDDIVDATRTGGMARFINHCCEPNAYARVISTDDISFDKHIVIFAARDIQEGEEITYDYKFPIEDTKLRCYCGASKCSGSMN